MTTDPTEDPFAQGGHEDGDQRVLALFSRWIAEVRIYTPDMEKDTEGTMWARIEGIAQEIADTRGGPVAMAIKAFLETRYAIWDLRERVPDEVGDAVLRYKPEGEPDILDNLRLSILRDAARIVPVIADLAAPMVHEDAALIDADMEIENDVNWLAEFGKEDRTKRRQEVEDKLSRALELVDTTEAKTARGEEIKRRRHAFGLSNVGRQARELKEEIDRLESRRRDVLIAYNTQLEALWAAKAGAA
jgi:hypothetical protein